jgi:hypothetical protein
VHLLTHLDAKRAGFVLVQGEAFALPINFVLLCQWADQPVGMVDHFTDQHEWAHDHAQGFKECSDKEFHDGCLSEEKYVA